MPRSALAYLIEMDEACRVPQVSPRRSGFGPALSFSYDFTENLTGACPHPRKTSSPDSTTPTAQSAPTTLSSSLSSATSSVSTAPRLPAGFSLTGKATFPCPHPHLAAPLSLQKPAYLFGQFGRCGLALPDGENSPSQFPQLGSPPLIASDVPKQLRPPVIHARPRHTAIPAFGV
jgi:hypothetical protein